MACLKAEGKLPEKNESWLCGGHKGLIVCGGGGSRVGRNHKTIGVLHPFTMARRKHYQASSMSSF